MPFHRIPRRDAETLIPQIEGNGEEVVTVHIEGDQYAVFTRTLGTVVATGTDVAFKPIQRVAIGDYSLPVGEVAIPTTPL